MTILQAIITGLVQGFTEFLPVSSSAHLVFTQHFLHQRLSEAENVSFDVLVHLGTLVAVLIYFRTDIWQLLRGAGRLLRGPGKAWREDAYSRLAALLLLGTIPAGLAGVLLKDFFERAFSSVPGTAALLLVTAALLFFISRRTPGERTLAQLTWRDALVIGIMQMVAILPGISRSGSTITGGLLRGLDREAAPRFSFLLSIPIILAGGLFGAKDMLELGGSLGAGTLAAGFLAAAVSGYLAVVLLLAMVRQGRLDRFAYYCVAAGMGMLLYWHFLVPKVDTAAVRGTVGVDTITWGVADADGPVLGFLPMGERWALQLPLQAGAVPITNVEVTDRDGQPLAHPPLSYLPVAKRETIAVQLVPLYPAHAADTSHADGEIREVWVILRNRWGIENAVPLRVLLMPMTRQHQLG